MLVNELEGRLRVIRIRESLFKQLGQEVRDVRQGPDGFIYFTTNDPSGRVMRIEPAS